MIRYNARVGILRVRPYIAIAHDIDIVQSLIHLRYGV